jgi:hypothetical protein
MRADPNWPAAAAEAAWTLATHPGLELRDGAAALRLARLACEATQYRNARLLDTLAAAHAEAGQFDQALAVARQAHEVAASGRDKKLEQEIPRRMEAYKGHQPFRQDQGRPR